MVGIENQKSEIEDLLLKEKISRIYYLDDNEIWLVYNQNSGLFNISEYLIGSVNKDINDIKIDDKFKHFTIDKIYDSWISGKLNTIIME